MATYDFECQDCGMADSRQHPISDIPDDTMCLECGGRAFRVLLSAPGIAIHPKDQACGSVFKWMGVDPVTGKGAEKL